MLHDVLVQTEEMSCGPAAAAMLIDIWHYRHHPGGPDAEMRLKQIAGRFPGSMVEQNKKWNSQGPLSGHGGSLVTNIESLLLHERIPLKAVWHRWQEKAGTSSLAVGNIHHRPALLLWGWYDAFGTRHGGHFTVAARVTKKGTVVILDPWDGSLGEIVAGGSYRTGLLDAAVYSG